MFRLYASHSHSYTILIPLWVSLERLQYGGLLLQNILAYMTSALLLQFGIFMGVTLLFSFLFAVVFRASIAPASYRIPITFDSYCWHDLIVDILQG